VGRWGVRKKFWASHHFYLQLLLTFLASYGKMCEVRVKPTLPTSITQKNTMTRLPLEDTVQNAVQNAVVRLADRNLGAVDALMALLRGSAEIDPDNVLGGMAPLINLNMLGIHGTSIYVLWNYKCRRDTRRLVMLLRAVQLGLISHTKVQKMAADKMRQVNLTGEEWADLDTAVCSRLTGFMSADAWIAKQN